MRAVSTLFVLAALSAGAAQAQPQDWQHANKAMGAAFEAGDTVAAASHARAALAAYRKAGTSSEKTLVSLALNVAEMALQANKELAAATSALSSVVKELEAKGGATAEARIYLHGALSELAKSQGNWSEVRNQIAAVARATRQAYGPLHVQTALAQVAHARELQRNGFVGPALSAFREASAIVEALQSGLDRSVGERALALFGLEGARYKEAQRRLEAAIAGLSPADPKQRAVWLLATASLATAQAKAGEKAQADATMARLTENTADNAKAEPLAIWSAADYSYMMPRQYSNIARVTFDIAPNGHPTNIKADAIDGNPQFAAMAAKAVADSRYLPVIRGGVPETSTGHSIRFETQAERAAPTGSRVQ